MRFLLRVIGMFVVLYAALSVVRRLLLAFTPAGHVPASASSAGNHLVKDPVCGTYVPQATAIHVADQYFCSEECARKRAH
jgi:hypothetical protein